MACWLLINSFGAETRIFQGDYVNTMTADGLALVSPVALLLTWFNFDPSMDN